MKKSLWHRFILILGVFFLGVGGFLFYYERNPQVYNTFAQSGINLNFLDTLGSWEREMDCGTYFTLVDEKGKELDQISRFVFVGDEFILENNHHYQVIKIDQQEQRAIAKLIGKEELVWREEWSTTTVMKKGTKEKGKVGVYMTHTDESYIPTDGVESKLGNGGILKVGKVFADSLNKEGVDTKISFNKHDPHDANAYHRSRKTAVQLLKNNLFALFDVHRDGVPDPGFYKTQIKGVSATKIRLVIGRQNPHMSANLAFAKSIKAYFDKNTPGFIKGIFLGKGNYNQDLGPRAVLLEVGTYTNSRTAAERGISHFAEGLPHVIGAAIGSGPVSPGAKPGLERAGTGKAVLWIFLFVIIGGGGFLLLSTGSWQGSITRLSELGKEFANYLGPKDIAEEASDDEEEGHINKHR